MKYKILAKILELTEKILMIFLKNLMQLKIILSKKGSKDWTIWINRYIKYILKIFRTKNNKNLNKNLKTGSHLNKNLKP